MKNVVITFEAREKVTGKELVKSVNKIKTSTNEVGFTGKLANGIKYIVRRTAIVLF